MHGWVHHIGGVAALVPKPTRALFDSVEQRQLRGRGMRDRFGLVVLIVVVLAACGPADSGDQPEDSETTSTQSQPAPETTTTAAAPATTTTAPEPTTTTESMEMIPDPTSGATLVPNSAENVVAGDVFIYWFRDTASGNYLAMYTGPGIAGSAGQMLCPGNSIFTTGFEHISNTPSETGACEGFTTMTAAMQVCSGGVWIYRTLIPGDLDGVLYGSLEWNSADGTITGLSSQFDTSPDLGTFEFGRSSYALWEGFTSDGSTSVSCSDPMP